MRRAAVLAYGLFCYFAFLAVFLYDVGFVGDFAVPKSINSGAAALPGEAFALDLLLLGLFAVQHSVMARPAFKGWWRNVTGPAAERSTYVLASSAVLALLFWQWQPLPGIIWEVRQPLEQAVLYGLFGIGWGVVLWSTFLISHFDLFGLRQVYLFARGEPYTPVGFRTPALYRYVRHPIMLGFLIAFWATPLMTVGHLLFAAATTAYIVAGVWLEERDLLRVHGEEYARYRQGVPALVPWAGRPVPRAGSVQRPFRLP